MPNLKNVIVEIAYFSFRGPNFERAGNNWRYINYSLYMETSVQNRFINHFAISSSVYCAGRLLNLIRPNNGFMCDSLGWGTKYDISKKSPHWDTKRAYDTIQRHTHDNTSYLLKNKSDLCHILQLCKEQSIRVVIVTTPTWSSYYNNINEEQYGEMLDIIQSLQLEYNVEYYNFMKDSRFAPDDFYDADHLSNVGAKKFSLILADTLGI